MIPRLSAALSSRLPYTLSFALFSTTASSSKPSPHQLKQMSVKQNVDDIIASNKIAVFSKSWCPYCKKVKALLKDKFPDVEPNFVELDKIEDGSAIQDYLVEKTGQRTVPNVFFGGKHIGGCDDTFAANKAGTLTELIKAPQVPRL